MVKISVFDEDQKQSLAKKGAVPSGAPKRTTSVNIGTQAHKPNPGKMPKKS